MVRDETLLLLWSIIKIADSTREWVGKIFGLLQPGLRGVPQEHNPAKLPSQGSLVILTAWANALPSRMHCLIRGWLITNSTWENFNCRHENSIRHMEYNASPSLLPPDWKLVGFFETEKSDRSDFRHRQASGRRVFTSNVINLSLDSLGKSALPSPLGAKEPDVDIKMAVEDFCLTLKTLGSLQC